jgi:hypothetical protein
MDTQVFREFENVHELMFLFKVTQTPRREMGYCFFFFVAWGIMQVLVHGQLPWRDKSCVAL